MPRPTSKLPLILVAVLMVIIAGLQRSIDPDRKYYSPNQTPEQLQNVGHQSQELLGGVLLGFREVAAGLLWVRADEYFHSGRYDELVPLFYIVTWLDPHQIDVYSTGAWHLAYNLGDQRLIPEGAKFLKKGIHDNAGIYDLYFQEGYLYDQKVKDYDSALSYYRQALAHPDSDGNPVPFYVDDAVVHTLGKDGRISEMIPAWEQAIAKTQSRYESARAAYLKKNPNGDPLSDTTVKNLKDAVDSQTRQRDTDKLRRDFFRKGIGQPGYMFDWKGKPFPHWTYVGDGKDHRINAHFDYQVKRIGARKLKVTGHIEGMDFWNKSGRHHMYTRLTYWIRDHGYEARYAPHADDFPWQKQNLTTYVKQVSFPTNERHATGAPAESNDFSFVIDLSKDPEDLEHKATDLFPLKADTYDLSVWMDPTDQSPFHQDVFGWKGEGLNDDHYIVTDHRGVRIIKKTITLKRSEIE